MRNMMKFTPVVAVSLLVAACGSSASSSSGSASPSASATPASQTSSGTLVKTGSVSSISGSVLVDSQGLTLYHLSGEQNGKWICTSSECVNVWHPLTASGTPSGSVGSLGTVKRPDGTTQVAFKGLPLYTFSGDTTPGEAKGQGIKDVGVWTAVTTSGATTSQPAAAPAPTTSSSGGGYGY